MLLSPSKALISSVGRHVALRVRVLLISSGLGTKRVRSTIEYLFNCLLLYTDNLIGAINDDR